MTGRLISKPENPADFSVFLLQPPKVHAMLTGLNSIDVGDGVFGGRRGRLGGSIPGSVSGNVGVAARLESVFFLFSFKELLT
ncbi:MAG TPA: hypothetical protein VGX76_18245 [Pirellulales bacterium]|nr:hypothetical protein [Pirellulales bacterium]